jgi:hypothetical protein
LAKQPITRSRSGHRRAQQLQRDVVLAAVAPEKRLEGGQDGHEERRLLLFADALQRRRELDRHPERHPPALETRPCRSRTVGRERERSRRRKLPFPVGELVLRSLGNQLVTLPPSVVDVLDREVRQNRFGSGCLCPVDFSDLPDEDAQGRAVTHDLVRDEEQDVLVG